MQSVNIYKYITNINLSMTQFVEYYSSLFTWVSYSERQIVCLWPVTNPDPLYYPDTLAYLYPVVYADPVAFLIYCSFKIVICKYKLFWTTILALVLLILDIEIC